MGVPLDLRQEMSFVRSVILAVFAHLLLMQPALVDRAIEGRVTVVRDVGTIIVAGTAVRLATSVVAAHCARGSDLWAW